jgi:hypothetical protein
VKVSLMCSLVSVQFVMEFPGKIDAPCVECNFFVKFACSISGKVLTRVEVYSFHVADSGKIPDYRGW